MKPTKRDIMIVEDFVKKTAKKVMNEATKISKTQPFKIYMPAIGELPDNHAVVTYDTENFMFKIRDDARRTTTMSEKDLLRKINSKEYILESTLKNITEGSAHNQIKYNMTTIHKQLQKLNQHVQSNPEFKDGDPIKSGLANVLVAFNKFFETNK